MELGQSWCFDVLHKYLFAGKRVAVVPFAFRDHDVYDAAGWDALYGPEKGIYYQLNMNGLTDHGIRPKDIVWVNYFRDSPLMAQMKLAAADIIYLLGGLPHRAYERVVEYGLDDIIRSHRGVVMAYSAGALITLDKYLISPDNDYPVYEMRRGLGLIDSFGIEVHFGMYDYQEECIKRYLRETGLPVYAIGDDGAIIAQDGRVSVHGNVTYFPAKHPHGLF